MSTIKARDQAMQSYADLMEEIKSRLEGLNAAVNGRTALSPQLVKEFGYLQLRMICELIALSALIAHGDIPATQKGELRTAWAADRIVKALTELHPDFFPVPDRKEHQGNGHIHMAEAPPGALTKEELITLVGRAGSILHRGHIKALMKTKSPVQHRYDDIVGWGMKIVALLEQHRILFADGRRVYYVALRAEQTQGKVLIVLGEASTD